MLGSGARKMLKWWSLLSRRSYLFAAAAAAAKSCPALCDPIDSSPPGSTIPGILQARTLEWGAISFSDASKWKVKGKSLSRVQLSATPWTAACQAPPSMGFSRQEYWSGVPLLSIWGDWKWKWKISSSESQHKVRSKCRTKTRLLKITGVRAPCFQMTVSKLPELRAMETCVTGAVIWGLWDLSGPLLVGTGLQHWGRFVPTF